MRVWIINHYAITADSTGGTRHFDFARELMKRGHEVLIIASNYNHFSQRFIATNSAVGEIDNSYDGVPFMWIPVPAYKGNTLARFWNMLVFSGKLLLKKYLPTHSRPDLIIGSSPHLFAALSACLLAKRLRVPFILEIRDIWPDTLVELGRFTDKHPLIKLMKWIERYLYKRATKVIALLPLAEQYLMNYGVQKNNIAWIPNAVNANNLIGLPTKLANKEFTIMYAGTHGLANDLKTVVQAAKILQEKNLHSGIKIRLLGDGPEKPSLKQFAQKENISIIEFMDPVLKKDVYEQLNVADAFLMLLKDSPVFRWGISPNKLFDYFMIGRPVLFGVNTPFNPVEIANAGVNIKASDPEALAMAIYDLSKKSPDELCAMGERARQYVLKYHHIQRLTDNMEATLNATLRSPTMTN